MLLKERPATITAAANIVIPAAGCSTDNTLHRHNFRYNARTERMYETKRSFCNFVRAAGADVIRTSESSSRHKESECAILSAAGSPAGNARQSADAAYMGWLGDARSEERGGVLRQGTGRCLLRHHTLEVQRLGRLCQRHCRAA